MSDATAQAPPAAPPEEESLAHDGPTFVHNGIIRFRMGERTVRVRRPFLGELKAIRLALQEVQDAITERSQDVARQGQAFIARGQEASKQLADKTIDADEHRRIVTEIAAEDQRVARELDDWREQLMLDWWRDAVFGSLALDDIPDQMQWPMWMLDRTLPGKCLGHWRTVPTGPG